MLTSRAGLAGACGEGRQLDACAVEHLWWQQGYPYRTATAILKPQFKYTHTKSTLKTIPAPKLKKEISLTCNLLSLDQAIFVIAILFQHLKVSVEVKAEK